MSSIQFTELTLMDALDLAILIEQEAEERYLEFTEIVGSGAEWDAADLFRTMASYEAKHGEQLKAQRAKSFGQTPSKMTRDMVWDVEAPSYHKPRTYMSAYQAMEIALDSEQKAHAFFEEALKHVKDVKVRELFTELRAEEVEHQNILKKWMNDYKGPKGSLRDDDDIDDPPAM